MAKTKNLCSPCLGILMLLAVGCAAISTDELYQYVDQSQPIHYVANGDNEFAELQLEEPIHFYSEKYDKLFINTNGILTFNNEFPEFINQPFPLEYPSIAPFYSNVDTTSGNESASISIFVSREPAQLERASELVQFAFVENAEFEASEIIVATWKNVGYFDSKTDKLNTFQVILIVDDDETFVQFIYPSGGLNWLQSETGSSGLPDIRAQAGFIAEDQRFLSLDGSGSDNARFFAEKSNVGTDGVWLYRVGSLNYEENVLAPTNEEAITDVTLADLSCAEEGHRQCHSHANCQDNREGFCCICQDGYYGNGRVCIKNDYPIRVAGSVTGEINRQNIGDNAKLQSYVVMADGRSYTAVNPLDAELGAQLRLALPIVSVIGWLFAKPISGAQNGYELTGGEFLHSSKLHFESGEVLTVNQTFEGLNYWDQLLVKIEIFGEVPHVNVDAKLHMADYIDEYKFVSARELRSVYAHSLEIPEENRVLNFQLDQSIYFERCLLDDEVDPTDSTVLQKVSKIVLDYFVRDQALRTSVLTKIGVDAESNACTDGSDACGDNTVCVPYEDTYRCDCLHGYAPELDQSGREICVDIDECTLGTHVCDENAVCSNNEGGFTCVCAEGFEGNGFRCHANDTADNLESSTFSSAGEYDESVNHREQLPTDGDETGEYESTSPPYTGYQDECQRCSHDADCVEGRCECRTGFQGDGYRCNRNCGHDEVWANDRCMPLLYDDREIEPKCDYMGYCICPGDYEFIEESRICRFVGQYDSDVKSDELVPCDVDANCHENATCEWFEHELRHACTCNQGFRGDGYNCDRIDDSCAIRPEICDSHAACNYNEAIGKSECQCNRGYEGDGFSCRLAPECSDNSHCGPNSYCDGGVCQCDSGFERDVSDMCVPAGRCGEVYCGANAICKWDTNQGAAYCDCMEGYEGDALSGCKSIPIPCNVRNTCGVHATCEPTEDPAKYECQCNAGYHGDGYVCIEDENCLNHPQMCDMNANCLSTNSGLVCVCNPGFYGNGSVCLERQNHDSGFLLVSQGVVIVRVPFNGKNVRPIAVASMAIGLDKDCVEGRIYWGDVSTKKIISAKYDGTDARPFITDDIESPEGIAVDSISRRLYWTDSVKDTIEVASLDDPSLRSVLFNKKLVNPRGIAVDPFREKLYWSDWDRESPKIEMSDLDGTGRELLLGNGSVVLPNSLVVLQNSGEVCYADAGTKKVECLDAYTKEVRTISNELTYPFGLSFTHDQFYWTDWITKKLEIVDTFGKRQKGLQIPFFGSHKMYAMTAVEDHCPQLSSPCQISNGGCNDNRLCLSNRKAPSGKNCKCTAKSQTCVAQSAYPGF